VKQCHYCLKRIWPWQSFIVLDAGTGPVHSKCLLRDVAHNHIAVSEEWIARVKKGDPQ